MAYDGEHFEVKTLTPAQQRAAEHADFLDTLRLEQYDQGHITTYGLSVECHCSVGWLMRRDANIKSLVDASVAFGIGFITDGIRLFGPVLETHTGEEIRHPTPQQAAHELRVVTGLIEPSPYVA